MNHFLTPFLSVSLLLFSVGLLPTDARGASPRLIVVGHGSVGECVRPSVSDVITERAGADALAFGFGILIRVGSGEMRSGEEPTSAIFASHFFVPLFSLFFIHYSFSACLVACLAYILTYFRAFVKGFLALFENFTILSQFNSSTLKNALFCRLIFCRVFFRLKIKKR